MEQELKLLEHQDICKCGRVKCRVSKRCKICNGKNNLGQLARIKSLKR